MALHTRLTGGMRRGALLFLATLIFPSVSAQEKRAPVLKPQTLQAYRATFTRPFQVEQRGERALYLIEVRNGKPVFQGPLGIESAETLWADEVWPGGSSEDSLTGSGIVLGIWESGGWPDIDHNEFKDGNGIRRIKVEGTHRTGAGKTRHATNMAGLMGASGYEALVKGLSYESRMEAYDDSLDTQEMALAAALGMRVSNHAYGPSQGWLGYKLRIDGNDGSHYLRIWLGDSDISDTEDYKFGFYTERSARWDTIAVEHPFYLPVVAVGNDRDSRHAGPHDPAKEDSHWVFTGASPTGWEISQVERPRDGGTSGYDTIIGGAQSSKNALSVGAIHPVSNGQCAQSLNPYEMTQVSGFGPTDDGRIKPDLVTPGQAQYTTDPNNETQCIGNGTSQASAAMSGALGLLLELQERLTPGSPFRSATWKALLIHTARDLGPDGPDYQFGWGVPDIAHAAALMKDDHTRGGDAWIRERTLPSGQTHAFDVEVAFNDTMLVTLAWTDPPGLPLDDPSRNLPPDQWIDNSTRMLVHDLDLRVTGPNGSTVFYPWTLDPSSPSALAVQTQDNDRDNVEQVMIPTPQAGTYTIEVSHKNALTEPNQAYSLVISAPGACLQAMTVAAGWNLVSVPCSASDMSRSTLFPDALSSAFGFDGSYTEAETLTPGQGYWIRFDDSDTYHLFGTQISPTTIAVSAGWNLIGPFDTPVDIEDLSTSGTTLLSDFFGFDGSYTQATTLEPDKGYWVRFSSNGTLIFPD